MPCGCKDLYFGSFNPNSLVPVGALTGLKALLERKGKNPLGSVDRCFLACKWITSHLPALLVSWAVLEGRQPGIVCYLGQPSSL